MSVKERFITLSSQRDFLNREINRLDKELEELSDKDSIFRGVESLYKQILDNLLGHSFKSIENLITDGLATVYGEHRLRFKLEPVDKRGMYTVVISTVDVTTGVEGPAEDTFGGAVVQVESFLLRIVFLIKTGMVPLLVLDESFNCVSSGYLSNLSNLLKDICNKFNLDILLVTHQREFIDTADKVFNAKNDSGLIITTLDNRKPNGS